MNEPVRSWPDSRIVDEVLGEAPGRRLAPTPPWIWPSSVSWLMTVPTSSTDEIAQHLDRAGLGIDLDLADMAAIGKVRDLRR